jgi:hypothetical protein
MERRLGSPAESVLAVQGNLSNTYQALGRPEEALSLRRDVYSGWLKLMGEENSNTILAATNYAVALAFYQKGFKQAKSVLRKTLPVARRVLGESHELTLRTRWIYADVLYENPAAMLDDVREAVTTLKDVEPIARRVLGGAHPLTVEIELHLEKSRAALRARETPSPR